jgi:lysophospholipase L1-like esterase
MKCHLYAVLFFLGVHDDIAHVAAATYPARTIAIVGSSTAAGTGAIDYAHAWAGLYTTNLASLNSSNMVDNLAVGGYTTYQTLPTGTINPANRPAVDTAHNITAALASRPDAVIINLPSNDAANGYSESETETNFLVMAAACVASNVPVWITTTQPRNLTAVGRTNLMDVGNWITSTFTAYPECFLDFWTTVANTDGTINATYDSGDGIHLNNAGHQILYRRVVASRLYELISAPRTLTTQPVPGAVNIGFDTLPGIDFVLESSPDLAGWQTAGDTVGNGEPSSVNVSSTNPASYFRLRLTPAQ